MIKFIAHFILFLIICLLPSNQDITPVINRVEQRLKTIKTYQFILVKRELVNNRDTGYQYIAAKVQTKPLKIYLKFLKPARVKGREVLYYNDELIVHKGGQFISNLVLHLQPNSPAAMKDNRYPITHMNPTVIAKTLVNKINTELQYKDTTLHIFPNVQVYKQLGTLYQLVHHKQYDGQEFQAAEILVSSKFDIPIYFKVVGWNNKVLEEYAFKDLKLNIEFPKDTFKQTNPLYHLRDNEKEK